MRAPKDLELAFHIRSSLKPYTLYPIPYTLYPIPYTLYPIPYTLSLGLPTAALGAQQQRYVLLGLLQPTFTIFPRDATIVVRIESG
jgi:hypothetical protein